MRDPKKYARPLQPIAALFTRSPRMRLLAQAQFAEEHTRMNPPRPVFAGVPSPILWAGLPFVMVFGVSGLIAAINWDYESKLLVPDNTASEWTGVHMGIILFAMAIGMTLLASAVLLVVRLFVSGGRAPWIMFATLTAVAILFIFPALFLVILGPASITMIQQMRAAPR
jgi:hypothetical protein